MANFIESLREIVNDDELECAEKDLRPAKLATLKKYRTAIFHYRENAVQQSDGRTHLNIDASKIHMYESAMKAYNTYTAFGSLWRRRDDKKVRSKTG